MNKVLLIGRLTKDPDIRWTQGQDAKCVARYTLALNRAKKDEADFISCVAFGKNGEFADKYLHKGTKIHVEGTIQTGSYTNRDGQKVYTTDVVVEDQEFAESKAASSANSGNFGNYQQPSSRPTPSSAVSDGFMNIPDGIDEELPFN